MKKYRRLFMWVEGEQDRLFFEKIKELSPFRKNDNIPIVPYANKPVSWCKSYIYSIKCMDKEPNIVADYIYFTDLNTASSIIERKEEVKKCLRRVIDEDKIIVIEKEIEGWYLAGLNKKDTKRLGISRYYRKTEDITKEQFATLISRTFVSKKAFLIEALKYFSVKTAKKKNRSFKYFAEKYKIKNS